LNAGVAVSVDVDALLEAAGSRAASEAADLVAKGRVAGLTAVDGGFRACVTGPGGARTAVMVTVAGSGLAVDCDRHGGPASGLCEHAVAVVVAARDAGLDWNQTSRAAGDPERVGAAAEVERAAADLTRTELVRLVVAQAAGDRLFAARVLRQAGRLGPADAVELTRVRRLVREAGAIPETNRRWELHDLVEAGRSMVAELEIVAVRPATDDVLDLLEEAVRVWDRLAAFLWDAWDVYESAPGDIGRAIAELHRRVCEELRPDAVELGRRLAHLVASAEVDSFLDAPDGYADLLGDDGFAAFMAAGGH
jgi:uncharacterized Zn finger protein